MAHLLASNAPRQVDANFMEWVHLYVDASFDPDSYSGVGGVLLDSKGRCLVSFETWQCNRAHISLKATIDVPLLGTVIEQYGDGLLDDSLMPVGWVLHLDGAVKQWCVHRTATFQELTGLLRTYDMKRDLIELNYKAAQWGVGAVWNRKYMETNTGKSMRQMWIDCEADINKKVTNLTQVKDSDLRRANEAVAAKPAARLPPSTFLQALGTPDISKVPPQTASLASICENRAFAVLHQMQTGRSPIIKKDGGEMLVAMVLDRPLADAQSLVHNPIKFVDEILQIFDDKKSHPVIEQMLKADVRDDLPISEFDSTTPASSSTGQIRLTQNPSQPKEHYGEYQ